MWLLTMYMLLYILTARKGMLFIGSNSKMGGLLRGVECLKHFMTEYYVFDFIAAECRVLKQGRAKKWN